MHHVIKRCSAVFFSRGQRTGHHGRRRLLNLLSDRTILPKGGRRNLRRDSQVRLSMHQSVCNALWETVRTLTVFKNDKVLFSCFFKHSIVLVAVVQSVTVGPRYGTGRFSLKSSVSGSLDFLCVEILKIPVIFLNMYNRKPSRWRAKMFSSQPHSHCR